MSAGVRAGYKQTEVGVIPEDWDCPLLDIIAKRGSGHTPDKQHAEYWNGNIKWISLRDSDVLDQLFIEDTAASITAAGIANSSAVVHPAGTVVMSRDAGVGKSAIMKYEMAVSQHFMAWQCTSRLNNIFLYYWLQKKKAEFERIAMGNTIKTIGLPYFRALKVPTPPLAEQRAIATALSDVDALLSGLDSLIAKKQNLKQAAMQQLLTGQTRLPGFSGEWEVKRLGDVARITTGKKDVNEGNPVGQYPFFTCARAHTFSDNFSFDCEAILIAGNGEVGNLNYFNGQFEAYQRTYVLQNFAINVNYLWHQLSAHLVQSLGIGTIGSSIPYIKMENLVGFEFRLPVDAVEQTAIATVLSDMDTELAALQARRDKTRALKQGMMQELLTGRIRLV